MTSATADVIVPKNHLRLLFIPVLSALIFGMYPPASRAVYADGGNAVFVIIVTTWVRALSLAAFCLCTKKTLFSTRAITKDALIGGCFQSISILGIIGGLVFLPGPVVIIIMFSHTLMLLFFLAWRKEIKLDAATITTTAAALIGLTLVVDFWHQKIPGDWLGIGLAFMAALATMSRLYVYGRLTKTRAPAVVGAENFLVAAVITSAFALVNAPHLPLHSVSYIWLAVSAASLSIGSFGMFYGIALLGSFRWSLFSKLEPVFTAIFSALFIGEVLKIQQYAGIALVIASLIVYQLLTYKRT